jgi:hypothetical protein
MADALIGAPSWFLVILVLILLYFVVDSWKEKKEADKGRNFALQQNTIALVELRAAIRNLEEKLIDQHVRVANLEEDVDALHKSRRDKGQG